MLAPLVDIGAAGHADSTEGHASVHASPSMSQSPFVPNHHEPFLPNFASALQTQGRTVFFSTANGDWHEQFPLLSENDVVVVNHDIEINGVADLHSIVINHGGRLHFDVNGNQHLQVVNLQVLEGGALEIGTESQNHQGTAEMLNTENLRQLDFTSFSRLGPQQILQLSQEQLSAVPGYYWFIRISQESRDALSDAGIQWINGRFVFG